MTEHKLIAEIGALTEALPQKKPLVHVIPNGVSAAFCADVMAAAGGRPVMADCSMETGEITAHADAFAANLGQPSPEKEAAVRASLVAASQNLVPVIFDPVGAGASAYRRNIMSRLLALPWKGIIKGNASEIHTLKTGFLPHQGVDSVGFTTEALSEDNFSSHAFSDRILAITGKKDRILDAASHREAILIHKGPHPYTVVGTGCAAGCLCGCFAAITDDLFLAAAAALSLFGYVQSKIDKDCGYGSFKERLLDLLSFPDTEDFLHYLQTVLICKSV